MRTKDCSICKKSKDISEFRARETKRGGWHSYCIECQDEYLKERYRQKREKYLESAKKNQRVIRDYWAGIINKVKDKPCMDCGKRFPPVCMDLDHRDPSTKRASVAALRLRLKSKKREQEILDEIAKCDVVCACCHRLRTFKEKLATGQLQ